jgi:hypothetical protein
MPGLTDAGEIAVLDEIYNAGGGTFPAADIYLQLHNGDPGENGTTNIIAVARVQVATGAAAAGTLSNSGNIDFASMPAVTTPGVVAWSAWDTADPTPADGSPVGVCYQTGWMSTVGRVGVVSDATDVTANDIRSPGHGFVGDDRVVMEQIEAETMPTGPTAGTLYFVLTAGLTTDTFNISATSGGAEVDITVKGVAMWRKVVGKTVNSGDTYRISTGDLDIYAD